MLHSSNPWALPYVRSAIYRTWKKKRRTDKMIAERSDIHNFSTGTQAQIPHTFVGEDLLMSIPSNLVIGKDERSNVYK